MFTEILVPTDGSEEADRAIEVAVAIGEAFDARVHALYAISFQSYYHLQRARPAVHGGRESR